VAASHSYLRYVESSSKDRTPAPQPNQPEGIRFVLGIHRFWLKLSCPSHQWNWPRPIQGDKPSGFDAHQTCFKCMTERFYNTRTLQAGPLYRTRVSGTEEQSARDFTARGSSGEAKFPGTLGRGILRLGKALRG
jgi:hypothetical protein